MVQPATTEEMAELNAKLRLHCSVEDLETYRGLITDLLESYKHIDTLPAPALPVKYPRTPGYRPQPGDNPYSAWYWKCDIQGASEGKLHGRTIAVKDNIAVAGVPMMNGSKLMEGYTPEYDATVVTRVLDAGGRILGKSACEGLCLGGSSYTNSKAPVQNPASPEHSAGGSSSGSAALVVSGHVDLALGADQGGSIRIPASWCGIVGLKPTWGLVPYTGAVSIETSVDHLGPMTKNVQDCAILLEVLAGYDEGLDHRQHPGFTVPEYSKQLITDLSGKCIGLVKEGFDLSEEATAKIVRAAALSLQTVGAKVEDVSIPMHNDGEHIWDPVCLEGAYDNLTRGHGHGFGNKGFYSTSLQQALARGLETRPWDLSEVMKLATLFGEHVRKRSHNRFYGHRQNLNRTLMHAYNMALAQYDVIVMPTIPFPAIRLPVKSSPLTDRLEKSLGMIANTAPFNITGHPALSINAGFIGKLPVGMMIIGRHFDEVSVLQIAHAFEKLRT